MSDKKKETKTKGLILRHKDGKLKSGAQLYKLRDYKPTGYKITPTELMQKAREYIEDTKARPIMQNAIHQRSGEIIQIPLQRPLTIEGLCNYIGITVKTLHNWEKPQQEPKTDEERERNASYLQIIARIRQLIYEDKLTGAAVGIYNANIIARDLGLTDKREVETTGDKKIKIELIPTNPSTGAPTRGENDITPDTIDITPEDS